MDEKMMCSICNRQYSNKFSLKRHIDTQHNNSQSKAKLGIHNTVMDNLHSEENTEDDEAQSSQQDNSIENGEVAEVEENSVSEG